MALKPENPNNLAREIAYLLDNDPIMASKIKEYISEERLCDLLTIKPNIINEPSLSVGESVNHIVSHSVTELLKLKRICND